MLAAHGATLIDTDAIARALALPGGAAIEPIRERFGTDAIAADGSLDRAAMRERAFSDPGALAALESILHPLIGAHAQDEAAKATGAVVFDVPLLVESPHWHDLVDRVLVVDCSEATQRARVAQRAGWSDEIVERVIAKQATRAKRLAAADAWIHNERIGLAQLQSEVAALAAAWGLAAA